ncbi:hypothetical protein [Chryseobacterium balustinum]|uniref:Uncharacterized protein n=1 Tax=Chryseobacterium balustinum TaxID=246 RepID=A0ABY1LBH9_9FLAO|nr:hypothetical protein [Chryseobacterium balustinum]SKB94236.1 hypothetical protein SAMN05421800_11578 [Chryseobacterium balustinum]
MRENEKKYVSFIWVSCLGLLSSILWAVLGFLAYVLFTSTILTEKKEVLDFLQNRSVTNTFLGLGLLFILSLGATSLFIKKIKNIEI